MLKSTRSRRGQLRFRRVDRNLPGLLRAHDDDAGIDLVAAQEVLVRPGETQRAATNVAIALPKGSYGLVAGRSSMAARGLLTHPGTIDPGFRGVIEIALTNVSAEPFTIWPGDRIAQLIVLSFLSPDLVEVDALEPSERGEGGWGSSGTR
ncbi:MAG: dUTP diphosphatase [Chloroflexi bacterium]|nr:dUTP diphosphatase [Chloroflexota bacterium]